MVDYDEIFSLVVRHTSIGTVLALVVHLDMKLKQMEVHTFFLYGDLEEHNLHKAARRVQLAWT